MSELFTRLQQITIARAAMVGFAVAAFYWFIGDDGSALERMNEGKRQQITTLQADIAKLEESVRLAKQYEVTISALGGQLTKISNYIPEKFSPVELMKLVGNEAKTAGLDILNLTENSSSASANSAEEDPVYNSFEVSAEFEGNYSQLLLFLSYLTKLDKIVTVGDFTIDSQTGTGTGAGLAPLRFVIKLLGYKYVQPKPPEGLEERPQ